MTDELDRLVERVRQNRAASSANEAATREQQRPRATLADGMLIAGDRVLDATTGREATVTSATGFGRSQLGTLTIRFDDGTAVTRRPRDLILRPAPPSGV